MIQFNNVEEKFRLYHQKNSDLKGRILDLIRGTRTTKAEFWALKGVSFEVRQGEVVGIIGENGSGKTTILNLIAGILKPDEGEIKIQGRVSALLELGTGFHHELSGRENIYLYGAVLGLGKKTIDAKFDEIVRFAELEKFIDAPVKTYSAGMYVRLGFAIAINVNPDILLIDEVLAVGDEAYQRKCIKEIEEFKARGKTIIFVSHNMSLVSRVCDRAIFLKEGRIISDSTAEEGISLYMQTVGEKKGIALLQKGPLDLIFNNGKILLCWNKKAITKDIGGYLTFWHKKTQYTSFGAEWQIVSRHNNSFTVRGTYHDIPVIQTWHLTLTEDGISWQIYLDNLQDKDIHQCQAGLMLSDKYKQWISGLDKGDFPELSNNKGWRNIGPVNGKSRFAGALVFQKDDLFIPAVIWDFLSMQSEYLVYIHNTDSFTSARVLNAKIVEPVATEKFSTNKYNNLFSSEILIFDREEKLNNYLKNIIMQNLIEMVKVIQQKAIALEKYIQQKAIALEIYIQQRSLERGRLKLLFEDNSIKIFWDGREITKAVGMYTALLLSDIWLWSQEAHWQIEKVEDSTMLVSLRWGHLPITQNWQINLAEDNSIKWDVYMNVEAGLKINQSHMGILLSEEYKKWAYSQKKGVFPDITPSDKYWQEVTLKDSFSQFAAVEVVDKGAHILPAVIFDISDFQTDGFTLVENTDYQIKARVLRSLTTDIENKCLTGEQPFCSAKIIISSKSCFIDGYYLENIANKKSINTDALKLIFEQSKIRLFYNEIELTKSLGLYTSIRSLGIWHDSTRAKWELKKISETKMQAYLRWLKLPIKQIWEIEILNNNQIKWSVKMQIYDNVQIEREQTNIMLRDDYFEWFVCDGRQGEFPKEFNDDYGGDWQSLWRGNPKTDFIAVSSLRDKNYFLPSIILSCPFQEDGYVINIVNSDRLFQGRVLQCLRVNNEKGNYFPPGRYSYFRGSILIKE